MRQRRLKGLEEKLRAYSNRITIDPSAVRGRWQELFEREQPIYMELGSGKGQFILNMAKEYPERNFIAVEGNRSVMLRALQKAERFFNAEGLSGNYIDIDVEPGKMESDPCHVAAYDCLYPVSGNLIFANMYFRSATDCFSEDELSGLYLNFSDPWPKKRCAKRRLTHRRYLAGYRVILRSGCCLKFKTDNEDLFRFSMEEFESSGLERLEYTEDLHSDDNEYDSAGFMTEYEEKFSAAGNRIYYCKVRFR